MFMSPIDTSALDAGAASTSSTTQKNTDPNAMQDRFLKLLVAQLQHQDPMNPMDNAQMTTQMAQINTVTGIQQLNQTVQSLSQQFAGMQQLAGVSLIGRSVLAEGDALSVSAGKGQGLFDLDQAATDVKVEVVTPGGNVVGSVPLGAQGGGRHAFEWDASGYSGDASALHYRVVAANGKDAVTATPLMQQPVLATGTDAKGLTLTLGNGSTVAYSAIRGVV
ncbi:MAG: flagellar biosynthesis protein FlgD [Comamonas sp. SCN 65-56]|uniref:flagellar hook assembly protein FlgD n=1 Tax=Comamonas sp. SCN 65-56 TaxID=1660095 RepID=UPI000868F2CC|nr:flagellar hook capping FlgD N-terminal domain-containing protein [Comamonas sp. SCN 65-56]ODS90616.1 MAG: flagellar biosynthesis protein FlgD [Comamonas sp. SCN 65-56]